MVRLLVEEAPAFLFILFISDCGTLTAPADGKLTFSSGTTFQSVATFHCDAGYTLVGNTTRICQANESWSNNDPSCQINDCGNLTAPANGNVTYSSGTTFQSVATFHCEAGYTLVGYTTRICQANESWSNSDPSCQINECNVLADIPYGTVTTNSTVYQSVAVYICKLGYTLVGHKTRTCQANKTWSEEEPVCALDSIENLGKYTAQTTTTVATVAQTSPTTIEPPPERNDDDTKFIIIIIVAAIVVIAIVGVSVSLVVARRRAQSFKQVSLDMQCRPWTDFNRLTCLEFMEDRRGDRIQIEAHEDDSFKYSKHRSETTSSRKQQDISLNSYQFYRGSMKDDTSGSYQLYREESTKREGDSYSHHQNMVDGLYLKHNFSYVSNTNHSPYSRPRRFHSRLNDRYGDNDNLFCDNDGLNDSGFRSEDDTI